ncbi:MAG: Kelch repeat-containing protein, partial [bacterium]
MPGFYTAGPIQFHLTVLLSLFLLFSCAPGKDDTEGEDRSTPYVASISPDNAATGVPTSKTITITFSKAIPPSQVTVDTDWQCSKNIQIAFDSSYSSCLPLSSNGGDNASKVFILTPNTKGEKIPSGTKFWIKISSSIKDYYDKEMDADKTSSFTTETRCSSGCSWSQVTTVGDLTARSGHSGLVFDKKMWLFGGTTGSSYFKETFNSDNGTWTSNTAPGWSGRENHVSLRFKGKMWVIGGGNSTSSYGDVWSSSTGLTWENQNVTNGFSARQGHAGVVFKDQMWILGGQ